jgi:glycosyltransferase involved in cell wall biosynthesis
MISVCIPAYNRSVGELVMTLHQQKSRLSDPVEIIVIDDASAEEYKRLNRQSEKYIDRLVELKSNVGRSRIRNLFLKYASQPYLLFIDGDSSIPDPEYLNNYLRVIKEKERVEVVVGGSTYPDERPELEKRLRWVYGKKSESRPADERNKDPYSSFKTNNVLIAAEVLKRVPFEESLSGYGHEDTLMGYRLRKHNITLLHIDNDVVNADPDTNGVFLQKSRQAVENLFAAWELLHFEKDFIAEVKLLRWVRRLNRYGLTHPVRWLLTVLLPMITFLLRKGVSSVFLLNLLKLHEALDVCSRRKVCRKFT